MAPLAHGVGQPRGNAEHVAELEAAIANVTRLLGRAEDPDAAAELVAERRAMRTELEALQQRAAGVLLLKDIRTRHSGTTR